MDIKTEQAIREVILAYFKGIFEGNDNQLEQVIHPNTILYGDILGTPYRKSRQEYIEGVRNRKSPKELGEDIQHGNPFYGSLWEQCSC